MTVQIAVVRRSLARRGARWAVRRCALAAIGAGIGAISITTFGADPATGFSQSITRISPVMHADNRSTTTQPHAPPDTKLDYLAAHVRMVDRLYEELMRWTPPGCSPTSTNASMDGGC